MTKSPSQFLEQAAQPEMLIEQNERLNFILNKTPALIGYWDSQLINQFSNDAYSRWFGKSPEQIKGQHLITYLAMTSIQACYLKLRVRLMAMSSALSVI